MSTTITTTPPAGAATDASSVNASSATQQSAAVTSSGKQGISLGQEAPAATPTPSSGRPALSPPTMSTSAMMLALMSLQTEVSDEAVQGGLETCTKDQADLKQELKARAEDMYGYYETMRKSDDVTGAMSIINIIFAALFLALAIVATVVTGGASATILAAGILSCISAATSLTSSVMSLPSVQQSIGEQGSKIASLVLGIIGVTTAIAGVAVGGVGAHKGHKGLKGKGADGKALGQDTLEVTKKTLSESRVKAQKAMQIMNIVTSAGSGLVGASMGVATGTFHYMAAEAQSKADEHSAEIEEIQASLDANISSLQGIMDNFADMVQSTANMLSTTAQGQRSAASV